MRSQTIGTMAGSGSTSSHYSRAAAAVLATTSGTVLRTNRLPQRPGPLVVDAPAGRAFAVGQAGDAITVLDATSGALVRTVALDHPLPSGFNWVDAVGTDEQRSHVFIASDRGTTARLVELDGHTGRVVQAIPLPVAPVALAIDGRAGRAVVAGSPFPQRSALEGLAATVSGLVASVLPPLQGLSLPGAGSGTASVPGGISVVDVSH